MEKINFEKSKELDYKVKEAYQTLRTNIQFCGNEIKVITLTSCIPNDEKSSISFNLAVSFAESGKKVILIDADLRESVLAERYRVGVIEDGLSHYLSGQKELSDVLFETNIENMDIIFSGLRYHNTAELLESERLSSLLHRLREIYDYVIVDTPPLGSVIDSAIIAKVTDGAILVIESNAISYRFAQKVKNQLEKSNCMILGALLNNVDIKKNGYYGKHYCKYIGTYGNKNSLDLSLNNQ